MKKYILFLIICFVFGYAISFVHSYNKKHDSYILLLIILLVFINPLLKFFFPKLKEMKLGTLDFFPNVLNWFKKK